MLLFGEPSNHTVKKSTWVILVRDLLSFFLFVGPFERIATTKPKKLECCHFLYAKYEKLFELPPVTKDRPRSPNDYDVGYLKALQKSVNSHSDMHIANR